MEEEKMTRYESAKEIYAKLGVDTDAAITKCEEIPVSLHCWQGDDVTGFDHDGPLTGGIQTTGNYPGKARTPEELLADMDKAMSLMPGKKKINVHACYAIFEDGEFVDRDKLEPKHFQKWVDFAKERGMGLDFNPTFFSHPMVKDGLTLSSPDEEVRNFWIEHGKACIRISQYFAEQTGVPCVMNIWTGDGFKDIPADRMGPRVRYKESIDAILSEPFDTNLVKPCVESKVFGIGVEAYTVGSAEFSLSYAAMNKDKCLPLMDNGHYHPTEVVSDKHILIIIYFFELSLYIYFFIFIYMSLCPYRRFLPIHMSSFKPYRQIFFKNSYIILCFKQISCKLVCVYTFPLKIKADYTTVHIIHNKRKCFFNKTLRHKIKCIITY
mgnify:CR=1 FL=1